MAAVSPGPLDGYRVLDLGNFVAGPFGSMLLADLGADVIKVESPAGDPMRPADRTFAGCQRGKRDLALDLKHPDAMEVMRRLVTTSDVVHHNFRPGVVERLRVSYDDLRRVRPDIVYCETPAYGSVGPRASWGGFDQLFQAYCGFERAGSGAGNPPMWYRAGFLDFSAGALSASAVVMALLHRELTGEGQRVEASILAAGLTGRSELYFTSDDDTVDRPRLDHDQTGYGPLYRIYPTQDGWLALAASTERGWEALRTADLGRALPDLALAAARRDADLGQLLADLFADGAAAEWARRLRAAGVPCEVVRESQEEALLNSAGAEEGGLAVASEHPVFGELRQIGALVDFSEDAFRPHRPPPLLGQHSVEILLELGYSRAECEALRGAGVVTWPDHG